MASETTTIDVRVRTVPDDATCATCRWWDQYTNISRPRGWGFCKKLAPTLTGGDKWPSAPEDDLCGEWEAEP